SVVPDLGGAVICMVVLASVGPPAGQGDQPGAAARVEDRPQSLEASAGALPGVVTAARVPHWGRAPTSDRDPQGGDPASAPESCRREVTPSFRSTLFMWYSTLETVTNSRVAISAFVAP